MNASKVLVILLCFSVYAQKSTPQPQRVPASPRAWAEEPDGFKGMKFGSTQIKLRQRMTFESCLPDQYGATLCYVDVSIGDNRAEGVFHFVKDRFSMIVGHCKQTECESLRAIFVERYGKPHEVKSEEAGSREVLSWKGKRTSVGLVNYVSQQQIMFYVGIRSYQEQREEGFEGKQIEKIKAAAKEL